MQNEKGKVITQGSLLLFNKQRITINYLETLTEPEQCYNTKDYRKINSVPLPLHLYSYFLLKFQNKDFDVDIKYYYLLWHMTELII